MIFSFGVARVLSVKAMHTRLPGLIHSHSGLAAIGFFNASMTALFSSCNPGRWEGAMTEVRSSGSSMGK